jgi:membrane protein DedA with SNARE-associated domain
VIGEYIGLFVLVAIMGAGIPGPGDAALIAAGTLAGQGKLSLTAVLIVAGVAVAGTLWVGGYVLVSYFLGPDAADLIRKIGLKGILGVVVIALVGLTLRWVWHRIRLRRA